MKAFETNFFILKRQGKQEFPGKNDTRQSRGVQPLPQTSLSLRKHNASSKKYVVRLLYMHVLKMKTVYVFNQVCSDVYNEVLFVCLTKCIQVGSTNVGWWDGGGGGRGEVKKGVRKAWSCKRGNRHRCRLWQWRQEEKQVRIEHQAAEKRFKMNETDEKFLILTDRRVDEMMAGRWMYCTWLSTSMAMSTNMSCSSLMLLSRRTMSLCLDSISLRACLEIPESTIWAGERSTVTTNSSSVYMKTCPPGHF